MDANRRLSAALSALSVYGSHLLVWPERIGESSVALWPNSNLPATKPAISEKWLFSVTDRRGRVYT